MFGPTLNFVRDLKANNQRDWFQANKARYQQEVVLPARRFCEAISSVLAEISPAILEGALFRIHRDVRFSKDKSPYKTHVGIQFRHEDGKDAHCPGYYLHLEPGECFAGAGMWQPPRPALLAIREAITHRPEAWAAARSGLELGGDSLKRAPRDHPHAVDLARKDFVAFHKFDDDLLQRGTEIVDFFAGFARQTAPLMDFLCLANGQAFAAVRL